MGEVSPLRRRPEPDEGARRLRAVPSGESPAAEALRRAGRGDETAFEGEDLTLATLFEPDTGPVLDVDDVDPDGWGITIEPAEGVEQPTGDILFTGTA